MLNLCQWQKCKLCISVSAIHYIPTTLQISSQVTYKRCIETEECSLARGRLQTCNLATLTVMTDSGDSNDRQ